MDTQRDHGTPIEPSVDSISDDPDRRPPSASPTALTPSEDAEGTVSRVADAATSAAGDAASTAGTEAKRVAAEASSQVRSVVEEAKGQLGGLVDQARHELQVQATERGAQAAGGLRSLSDQLEALTDGRPHEAGPLPGYVDQARNQVSTFAARLDEGGIEGVLGDMSSFARRRPGLFLAFAAGAGFLVGRMVRSGVSVARNDSGDASTSAPGAVPASSPELLPPPMPLSTGTLPS